MPDYAAERKHNATPLHRKKAREQGRYARSRDLSSALMLLAAVTLLWLTGSRMMTVVSHSLMSSMTIESLEDLQRQGMVARVQTGIANCLWAAMPLFIGVAAIAVIYQWLQSGFQLAPGKLGFDFSRVNPARGMRRIFELPTWIELVFGLLKVAVVITIVMVGLWRCWDQISQSPLLTVSEVAGLMWTSALTQCWQVACGLLLLGLAEYGVQWWRYEQELKMTDEELREELKTVSGDPQLSTKRQARRRELLGAVEQVTAK